MSPGVIGKVPHSVWVQWEALSGGGLLLYFTPKFVCQVLFKTPCPGADLPQLCNREKEKQQTAKDIKNMRSLRTDRTLKVPAVGTGDRRISYRKLHHGVKAPTGTPAPGSVWAGFGNSQCWVRLSLLTVSFTWKPHPKGTLCCAWESLSREFQLAAWSGFPSQSLLAVCNLLIWLYSLLFAFSIVLLWFYLSWIPVASLYFLLVIYSSIFAYHILNKIHSFKT